MLWWSHILALLINSMMLLSASSVARAFRSPLRTSVVRPSSWLDYVHNRNNQRPTATARSLPRVAMARALFATHGGGSSSDTVDPPKARRDEDRVILAGTAPSGWPSDVPRQSDYSEHPLLDPPVPVPDPYGWMRDDSRTNQEVLDHLKAENDYSEKMTHHLESLRKTLYDEMLSSIQETDYTLPRPKGKYYHYSRTFEGKSYASYCRAPRIEGDEELPEIVWDGTATSPILPNEQVKLDVNELAKGKDYCAVGSVTQSPSEELLAYTVDFKGDEQCELYIKNLETGVMVDHDPSLKMYGRVLWGNDDSTMFYLKLDDTLRPFQVYRRTIGSEEDDELLYEETDEMYWTSISKSLDDKYLFIETSSTETSEVWFLDLEDKDASLQCISKRRFKVLYDVEHRHGQWWITSNVEETPNMRLFTAPAKANCETEWALVTDPTSGKPIFDGGYQRALHGVSTFSNHVVAEGREGGMPRVWLLSMDQTQEERNKLVKFDTLQFPEAAHDAGLSSHFEFDIDKIVVAYDSLITPLQHLEIALNDPEGPRKVLKDKNVPGYDKDLYGRYSIVELPSEHAGSLQIQLRCFPNRDPDQFCTTTYCFHDSLHQDAIALWSCLATAKRKFLSTWFIAKTSWKNTLLTGNQSTPICTDTGPTKHVWKLLLVPQDLRCSTEAWFMP